MSKSNPTEHYCPDQPGDATWAPGGTNLCEYHDKRGRTQIYFKSTQEKRRLDKSGGVRGVDRGNYIHAPEGG